MFIKCARVKKSDGRKGYTTQSKQIILRKLKVLDSTVEPAYPQFFGGT